MMSFPESITAAAGPAVWREEGIGKSGARVLVSGDHVLKIRPAGSPDTADTEILRWLKGRLPCPEVEAHEIVDGQDWLLMSRVRGRMLCDRDVLVRPSLLLDCMAEALHLLWRIPTEECPFRNGIADSLAAAEARVRSGKVNIADSEPETYGPGGFRDAEELLGWLQSHQPPLDPAVTHGDFCLPNLFTDGQRLCGVIDVGGCGVADRWMDLALGWRSLKHNTDGHYGFRCENVDPDDLFRAAGVEKDEEKLRYYLLLDELF